MSIGTVLVACVRDVENTRSHCSRVNYRNPRVHQGFHGGRGRG